MVNNQNFIVPNFMKKFVFFILKIKKYYFIFIFYFLLHINIISHNKLLLGKMIQNMYSIMFCKTFQEDKKLVYFMTCHEKFLYWNS